MTAQMSEWDSNVDLRNSLKRRRKNTARKSTGWKNPLKTHHSTIKRRRHGDDIHCARRCTGPRKSCCVICNSSDEEEEEEERRSDQRKDHVVITLSSDEEEEEKHRSDQRHDHVVITLSSDEEEEQEQHDEQRTKPRIRCGTGRYLQSKGQKCPQPVAASNSSLDNRRLALPGIRRHVRKSTNLQIPRIPFAKVVKEVTATVCKDRNLSFSAPPKWQSLALTAVQEAAETYLTVLFEDCNLLAVHANRVTVFPRDIDIIRRLCGPFDASRHT